jgi:hypothetical protein
MSTGLGKSDIRKNRLSFTCNNRKLSKCEEYVGM